MVIQQILVRGIAVYAIVVAFALVAFVFTPRAAEAYPFGGQVAAVWGCYDQKIYAMLSGPIGGPYVWDHSKTRTYQFGPPRRTGQWLLGIAGGPSFCVRSVNPLYVPPATLIVMMGSSQ